MEPRIQYAKSKDGVSIAYWTLGEGTPFVHMPMQFSHIQLECQWPDARRWYERLAEKRMLVRYDGRGSGLSDRDVDSLRSFAHHYLTLMPRRSGRATHRLFLRAATSPSRARRQRCVR